MIWNNQLDIFRNFETDLGLPKWNKFPRTQIKDEQDGESGFIVASRIRNAGVVMGDSVSNIYDDERAFYEWTAMSWWGRLWLSLKKAVGLEKKKVASQRPSLSAIKRVFENVIDKSGFLSSVAAENHGDSSQIGNLLLELAAYSKMIEQARVNGQTALVESLQDTCVIFLYETVLAACGFNRFVDEKMLVDFLALHDDKLVEGEDIASTNRRYYSGFRLDWMKNFVRVLPADVVNKKKVADSLLIFDNYVVFHYDPEGAASALTKKEEEAARKDPILFGVIKGSKKLYYIADWVDEYCDLTLQEVVGKLKEGAKYCDNNFELKVSEYRKNLGEIGKALVAAELKDLDEVEKIVRIWLA